VFSQYGREYQACKYFVLRLVNGLFVCAHASVNIRNTTSNSLLCRCMALRYSIISSAHTVARNYCDERSLKK
jgi:hypothetical protein